MVRIQGWGSDEPVFKKVIDDVKPKTIIEVGSWKGASAVHMASLCDATIYCVDTWLGDMVNWERMDGGVNPESHLPLNSIGYPAVFDEFHKNIEEYRHRIFPVIMTSWQGAFYLYKKKVFADLIYIDASHYFMEVLRDAEVYWDLLNEGGVMMFDDYQFSLWVEVKKAVDIFMKEKNLVGECIDRKMVIRKSKRGEQD